jgi:hypothetical protein
MRTGLRWWFVPDWQVDDVGDTSPFSQESPHWWRPGGPRSAPRPARIIASEGVADPVEAPLAEGCEVLVELGTIAR